MKHRSINFAKVILLSCLFAVGFYGCSEDNNPVDNGGEYDVSVSRLLNELNFARTNPKQYAAKLQQRLSRFNGKLYTDETGKSWVTNEGAAAVVEAISVLNTTESMSALTYNDLISKACRYHVDDIGPQGLTQHESTNGESFANRLKRYVLYGTAGECIEFGNVSAEEVIALLIIDDGVSNRGHRVNMLNSKYKYAGFAWGYHKTYGMMCVMDFTDSVTPV